MDLLWNYQHVWEKQTSPSMQELINAVNNNNTSPGNHLKGWVEAGYILLFILLSKEFSEKTKTHNELLSLTTCAEALRTLKEYNFVF